MKSEKGTYALVLALGQEATLAVGKLGLFPFPSGHYLYFGSALRGLGSRVGRHLRAKKSPRWHIDYLRQKCKVVGVWYTASPIRLECTWYKAARRVPGAFSPIAGFGSSDCYCPSHLVYFASLPSFSVFQYYLGRQGASLMRLGLEEAKMGDTTGG